MSSLSEQISAAVALHAAFAIEGNKIIDRMTQNEKNRVIRAWFDFTEFPSLSCIKFSPPLNFVKYPP